MASESSNDREITSIFSSISRERRWVHQMEKEFEKELKIDIKCDLPCISRVPETLRAEKPEAYAPKRIGLGPYHHFRPELYHTEGVKLIAVKNVVTTDQIAQFRQLVVGKLVELEPAARACYRDYLDLEGHTLAWIWAIDGLFLHHHLGVPVPVDSACKNVLAQDIFMLENQIPIILLQKIEELIPQVQLSDQVVRDFCEAHSPLKWTNKHGQGSVERTPAHLLDCLYHLVVNHGNLHLKVWKKKEEEDAPLLGAAPLGEEEDAPPLGADPLGEEEEEEAALLGADPLGGEEEEEEEEDAPLLGAAPLGEEEHAPPLGADPLGEEEEEEEGGGGEEAALLGGEEEEEEEAALLGGEGKEEEEEEEEGGEEAALLGGEEEEEEEEEAAPLGEEEDAPPLEADPPGADTNLCIAVSVVIDLIKQLQLTAVEIEIPSVSSLQKNAGVKFAIAEGGIRGIKFDEETCTLNLPEITLDDNSEVILRNLVAYEALALPAGSTRELAEYIDFMCGIIDTAEDVKILQGQKIILIKDDLSHHQIANIFNGITKFTNKDKQSKLVEKVNKHYNSMLMVKAWRLVKKCSHSSRKFVKASWKVLCFFYFLLLITVLILQAFCDIYGCNWGRRQNFILRMAE